MFIIDGHEDLAYNILNFGRDYTCSAAQTRAREAGSETIKHNGSTLLGWQDYQDARTALVFATLYASPERKRMGDWNELYYRTPDEAHRLYMQQVDVYHKLVDEHPDKFRLVQTQADLRQTLAPWEVDLASVSGNPVGLLILMECADGVRAPAELEEWWARGVRIIGPAWAGTRFCGGTGEPGPLTQEGYALLDGMASFGFVLDLSHMDQQAALQALDHYQGNLIASHANALALLPGSESNRHLPDRVIQGILERNGVIGVVPYNLFLKAGWQKGGDRAEVPLDAVAAQIDYICQLAGDAWHAGIGSDFDGGFGVESTPAGIDSIADLHRLAPLLAARGYSDDDIAAIFGLNWRRMLERSLP
jgi:membrane dipeptidase